MTWQQYQDWVAQYNAQPWGEQRADMRQMVILAALLAPTMPEGFEFPSPLYPYFENDAPAIDLSAAAEHIEAHKRRYNLS